MHRLKVIVILWVFDVLNKNRKITSKQIFDQFDITERQLWSYMADVKKYYKEFGSDVLVYDKSIKEYKLVAKSK